MSFLYEHIPDSEHAFLWLPKKAVTMQLFKKLGRARKKWHTKALLIDPHKTRILIVSACDEPTHVPPSMQKIEPDSPAKELS